MGRVAIVTDSASDFDPARAASLGIAIVPLVVSFGNGHLLGRARPVGARTSGRASRRPARRSRRRPRAAPARSRSPTRRPSTRVPSPSSRSTSRTRCRARSRPPRWRSSRSRAERSRSSTRCRHRWAKGCSRSSGSRWRRPAPPRARSRRRSNVVAPTCRSTWPWRRSNTSSAADESAAHRPRSARSSRSSRSSRSRTARSRRPSACARAGKARERLIELFAARPIERLSILHTTDAGVEEFADQLVAAVGIDRSKVTIDLVGPSVGPHLGPGCVGGVALYTEGSRPG